MIAREDSRVAKLLAQELELAKLELQADIWAVHW